MKILVILTGGTIGSNVKNGIIDVAAKPMLVNMYEQIYGKNVKFDVVQPLNILSENMEPKNWKAILEALRTSEGYDGAIIAHGTDTLSYTSAAVGYVYCMSSIPIILTGANKPLSEPDSDGIRNFKDAVDIICSGILKGVYTVFEGKVYVATRIMESDSYEDKYRSYGGKAFAEIHDGKLDICCHLGKNNGLLIKNIPDFDKKVLFIRPYPGIDYRKINTDGYAAVIHYLYHSGTADARVCEFMNQCKLPFYAASFKPDAKLYASGNKLLKAGAIPLYNISPEAAYVKAVIAYNQTQIPPIDYMKNNIYFEML